MNIKKQLALLLTLSITLQSLALPIDTVWARKKTVEAPKMTAVSKEDIPYTKLMRELNAVQEEEVLSVQPLRKETAVKFKQKGKQKKKPKYSKAELEVVFDGFINKEEKKLKKLGVEEKKQKKYLQRLEKQKKKLQNPELLRVKSVKTEKALKEIKVPKKPSGFKFQDEKIKIKSLKPKKEKSFMKKVLQKVSFWAAPKTNADYALAELPELNDLQTGDQEIELTREIYTLANELENNPVKIVNFVKNYIEYEPYYGAKKGANGCLQEKVCNDTDATSLTIALMRASGIPARYKKDLIQLPVEQLQALLAVEETKTVYAALDWNKVPVYLVSGNDLGDDFQLADFSQETHLAIEWTYPEIFYEQDHRGGNFTNETILTGTGIETTTDLRNELINYPKKQWIAIEPTLKKYTNTHNEIVPETANFNTNNFWKSFLQYQGDLAPLEKYAEELLSQTGKDISNTQYQSTKTLIKEEFQILPPALPYEIVSNTEYPTENWTELPQNRKHKVTLSLLKPNGTTVLSHELNASEANNAAIDLFYEGATETDQSTIESYGGIHATPAELVEIKPYLNLNHKQLTATQNVQIGETLTLRFEYTLNGESLETSEKFSVAGNSEGIFMTFSRIKENGFLDDTTDPPEADWRENQNSKILLEGNTEIARQYLLRMQTHGDALEKILDIDYNLNFSRAVVTQNRILTKVDGVPTTFDFKGLTIDAHSYIQDYSRKGAWNNHREDFHLLWGLQSSYDEAKIFEDVAGLDSISTVQGLQHAYANPTEYSVLEINSSNESIIDTLTEFSANTRADMHAAVQAGSTIITPDDFVSSGNWYGIFYIVLRASGSANYAIGEQVMGNGGWTEDLILNDGGEMIDGYYVINYQVEKDNYYFYYQDWTKQAGKLCKLSTSDNTEIQQAIDNNAILTEEQKKLLGKPCYKGGALTHNYYLTTNGVKLTSLDNSYDYWTYVPTILLAMDTYITEKKAISQSEINEDPNLELVKIGNDFKRYDNFRFSTSLGTYIQGACENENLGSCPDNDEGAIYYSPNSNGGNIFRSKGEIFSKLSGNNNYVAREKVGFPVGHERYADAYIVDWGRDTKGYKQDFVEGKVIVETNYFNEAFYVPGLISTFYDTNGGTGGSFGFPVGDPYYKNDDYTLKQRFEVEGITWDTKKQTVDFEYAANYYCDEIDTNADWIVGKAALQGLFEGGTSLVKGAIVFGAMVGVTGTTIDFIFGTHGGATIATWALIGGFVIKVMADIYSQGVDNFLEGIDEKIKYEIKHAECPARQAYLFAKYVPAFSVILLGMRDLATSTPKTLKGFTITNNIFTASTSDLLPRLKNAFIYNVKLFVPSFKRGKSDLEAIVAKTNEKLADRVIIERAKLGRDLTEAELAGVASKLYAEDILVAIETAFPKVRGKLRIVEREILEPRDLETFVNDTHFTVETLEPVTVYRANDNGVNALKNGRFSTLTDIRSMSKEEIQELLAIASEWNNITYVSEIVIPRGEKINIGFAKEQPEFGLSGGGNQVIINSEPKLIEPWVVNNQPIQ